MKRFLLLCDFRLLPQVAGALAMVLLVGNGTLLSGVDASPTQNERFKFVADDAAEIDYFGRTVGISGNTAIVGADNDDDDGPKSGSAYLFDVTTGAQRKLTASDAKHNDEFGISVGISGDAAIVGAWGTDPLPSAYLFNVMTGVQRFKLTPTDAIDNNAFGYAAAIDGNTAIVGACLDDEADISAGAAYLFDVDTGEERFKLTADEPMAYDHFGVSVAISGNTAIVGTDVDDDGQGGTGAAYLFDVRTGEQLFELTSDGTDPQDQFGAAVAINGDVAIVGAPHDIDCCGPGAAYLFDVNTGDQLFKLISPDGDGTRTDAFGAAVGISNIAIVVGAEFNDSGAGSAFLFDATTGKQIIKLITSDLAGRRLGESVAISGSTAIVGASHDEHAGRGSGAAYLFIPEPSTLFLVALTFIFCPRRFSR